MEMLDLTVIILTKNEEKHLARCLESIKGIARDIVVVDSLSTDGTKRIAISSGANFLENEFINHSIQFNWALEHADIQTEWVMRLDADEVVTAELKEALPDYIKGLKPEVCGITINRQFHFMGKFIRHGGIYPVRQLRIWRTGKGVCESRWMDEHIVVNGDIEHLNEDIADINLNNLSWWIEKHNHYATREAIDMLLLERSGSYGEGCDGYRASLNARVKRQLKNRIYSRIPGEVRSFMYFIYRYVLKAGFLDGRKGLIFHFLHAFWYRLLVDAKINEIYYLMDVRRQSVEDVVKAEYGYDV